MNNNTGWISLHRKITTTSFYHDSKAVHLAVHILLMATHKESNIIVGRQTIQLKRGQFLGGYKRLALELKWHKSQVRRAVCKLREAGFVSLFVTNAYSVITVENYDSYQSPSAEIDPPLSDEIDPRCRLGTPGGAVSDPPLSAVSDPHSIMNNNNVNNIVHVDVDGCLNNQEKKKIFEEFWSQYPRRVGKKVSERYFNSSVRTYDDVENMAIALKHYKQSEKVKNNYIMNGSTWFNNWQDFIEDPDQSEDEVAIRKMKESLR